MGLIKKFAHMWHVHITSNATMHVKSGFAQNHGTRMSHHFDDFALLTFAACWPQSRPQSLSSLNANFPKIWICLALEVVEFHKVSLKSLILIIFWVSLSLIEFSTYMICTQYQQCNYACQVIFCSISWDMCVPWNSLFVGFDACRL